MNRAYIALVLILMIPIWADAQDAAEVPSNVDNADVYLPSDVDLEAELWETIDLDYSELWSDMDWLCEILLELCLELEVEDEDIDEMFSDQWLPDYEFYPLWEDEWLYW